MKQKWKRIMAGFLAILTIFTTLFSNGTTAFAASARLKKSPPEKIDVKLATSLTASRFP